MVCKHPLLIKLAQSDVIAMISYQSLPIQFVWQTMKYIHDLKVAKSKPSPPPSPPHTHNPTIIFCDINTQQRVLNKVNITCTFWNGREWPGNELLGWHCL